MAAWPRERAAAAGRVGDAATGASLCTRCVGAAAPQPLGSPVPDERGACCAARTAAVGLPDAAQRSCGNRRPSAAHVRRGGTDPARSHPIRPGGVILCIFGRRLAALGRRVARHGLRCPPTGLGRFSAATPLARRRQAGRRPPQLEHRRLHRDSGRTVGREGAGRCTSSARPRRPPSVVHGNVPAASGGDPAADGSCFAPAPGVPRAEPRRPRFGPHCPSSPPRSAARGRGHWGRGGRGPGGGGAARL